MPFRCEFTINPEKPGVEVAIMVLREPVAYEMTMWQPPKPPERKADD